MLDPVPMRFRTDDSWIAELKARGETFEKYYPGCDKCAPDKDCGSRPTPERRAAWDAVEPARPGDTWRITWHGSGAVAGYFIHCPKCGQNHGWSTATNCNLIKDREGTNPDGTVYRYRSCDHSGVSSCWNWSGTAEQNALTATPSLYCQESLGGCGWHGFLTNGVLKHC